MHKKHEVRHLAYSLVVEGKNCITKLTDEDKEELASLIIEGYDKFRANEFITEADTTSELPYMLARYMKKRDSESAQSLLDTMVENAVRYAGNDIVDFLLEQEEEYNFNCKYDGDFQL